MKAFKYVLGYLLLIQLMLPSVVPLDLIFKDRMDYNLVKDNLESIDVILERISQQIQAENLQDYIIILGDSIAFSGPGNASQSLGPRIEELAAQADPEHPVRIYNLSMPAMQTGDIYTMLLKLDRHHISTQNLIVNVDYKGFVKRQPGPAIVFWLQDDLKFLDPASYEHMLQNWPGPSRAPTAVQARVHQLLWDHVQMFRYSGFIKKGFINGGRAMLGAPPADDALGDARPWFEKEGLVQVLQQPEYQQEFSDQPFDMSPANPEIYFWQKIIAHQQDKQTLIFLAAANQQLMADKVRNPGYIANLQQIDRYFQAQPVHYINVYGKINADLFSDHLHLTADGYNRLARLLWDNFN
jgi:hypothetical protein